MKKAAPILPINLKPLTPSVFPEVFQPTYSYSPRGGRLLLGHTTSPAPPITKGMQYL